MKRHGTKSKTTNEKNERKKYTLFPRFFYTRYYAELLSNVFKLIFLTSLPSSSIMLKSHACCRQTPWHFAACNAACILCIKEKWIFLVFRVRFYPISGGSRLKWNKLLRVFYGKQIELNGVFFLLQRCS